MNAKDFTTSILVDQDPATAFNAIKNFRAWWSEEIEGNTDQLGETFFYHYKDIHLCKLKLVEMVADKKLVYQVLDNQFNFIDDKSEWVDTKLVFEIEKQGAKTKVRFTHEGLVPNYACYAVCYDAWTGYIERSLCNLITTGKGEPNPTEGEGFNAQLAEKWKLNETASPNFTITLLVDQTPGEVFRAITNVRGWWSGEIEGETTKLNDVFTYCVGEIHFSEQKLVELVPDKKVLWLVTESSLNFIQDKSEWTGTKLSFEIAEKEDKTEVRFTHIGLIPEVECFNNCSNAWSQIIRLSLASLISTGQGVKIF